MNWKEHAHLFANGKFRYKTKRGFVDKIRSYYDLREKTGNNKAYGFNIMTRMNEIEALIARKIEDMTDEELDELYEWAPISTIDYSEPSEDDVKDICKEITDGFLYLLSIGVYPFDQSHFETGEVIDIKTI